jgi:hypothetical protein
MTKTDEFIKFCADTLEINFGKLAGGIISKAKARTNLADDSNASQYKEFIDILESNISVLAGKNRAVEMCNTLRTKATALTEYQTAPETPATSEMDRDIIRFLEKNNLPGEKDVLEYAKYLTIKYGGNAKDVQKEIIEKVKKHLKDTLNRNKLNEEINTFLIKFPQPLRTDVDDFISYIKIFKLTYNENELREEIEKERLYRKFYKHEAKEPVSELDQFVSLLKTKKDKASISKIMKSQEVSYLIKDESGISDQSLSEFADLVKPSEQDLMDTLEGIGLKHLISKK